VDTARAPRGARGKVGVLGRAVRSVAPARAASPWRVPCGSGRDWGPRRVRMRPWCWCAPCSMMQASRRWLPCTCSMNCFNRYKLCSDAVILSKLASEPNIIYTSQAPLVQANQTHPPCISGARLGLAWFTFARQARWRREPNTPIMTASIKVY